MKLCKRILGAFALLVATAVLLLAIAGGVGVWVVKEPFTTRANQVLAKVEAALDAADQGIDHVKASLARAAERLAEAREEQGKLTQEPQQKSAVRRIMARTVKQHVAPNLEIANEDLHTVAEATVVIRSLLADAGTFPLLSEFGLDLDRLTDMNRRLADVGPKAWELSRLLGEPAESPDQEGAQLSQVEQTMKTVQGWLAEYEPQLRQVRQQTAALKAATLPWITPIAAGISFACFWIALSQVSLMFHACSWWRQPGGLPK